MSGEQRSSQTFSQAASAWLDATAAVMKRMPRTPSSMPGTSRQAGSGARPDVLRVDLLGEIAIELRERLQIALRMAAGNARRVRGDRGRAGAAAADRARRLAERR